MSDLCEICDNPKKCGSANRTCGRKGCNRALVMLHKQEHGVRDGVDDAPVSRRGYHDLRKCTKQRMDLDGDDYSEGSRP